MSFLFCSWSGTTLEVRCGWGGVFFRHKVAISFFLLEGSGHTLCGNSWDSCLQQKNSDEVNEVSEDGKTSSSATPFNLLIRSPDEWLAYKIFFLSLADTPFPPASPHHLPPPPLRSKERWGNTWWDKAGRPSMSAFSQVCPWPGAAINNILGLPEAFKGHSCQCDRNYHGNMR